MSLECNISHIIKNLTIANTYVKEIMRKNDTVKYASAEVISGGLTSR